MVNQRIINIIWQLPIYPVSWMFRDPSNFDSGIIFKITKNNLDKLISVQLKSGNLFNIEIFNMLNQREYLIENVNPEDIVDEIDDYINGDYS